VDGFDPITRLPTLYEFHGCLWHGSPQCFHENIDSFPIVHAGRSLQEVYESTLRKHDQLQQEEMPKNLLDKSHRCSHILGQRQSRGTWCTPKLVKAVEVGYRTIKIHEVWHFPPEQRVKGLFADDVNTWLKIKQESAGYPSWATTPETKARYITQYKQNENIDLDPALIAKNLHAKPQLNSCSTASGENSANIFTNLPPMQSTMQPISSLTSPTHCSAYD